ncbi:hypothetical protein RCL_jg16220.t1 [Rhizophagus clarus]|uniref:Uncharacterized protein n=1 Tax=Rhizophagus clarus TaxID=94130 RepID=A0A8H3MIG1_9GLOM|nr:hypothetical protein RCL_jg16220.t1 [Rhizophagus clarus]
MERTKRDGKSERREWKKEKGKYEEERNRRKEWENMRGKVEITKGNGKAKEKNFKSSAKNFVLMLQYWCVRSTSCGVSSIFDEENALKRDNFTYNCVRTNKRGRENMRGKGKWLKKREKGRRKGKIF